MSELLVRAERPAAGDGSIVSIPPASAGGTSAALRSWRGGRDVPARRPADAREVRIVYIAGSYDVRSDRSRAIHNDPDHEWILRPAGA